MKADSESAEGSTSLSRSLSSTPVIISLLSDDDGGILPEADTRAARGFSQDEPIVVDSDEDIADYEPKQEASAQKLMASALPPRQAHSTSRLPDLAINERANRLQERNDIDPEPEVLLNGEGSSLQG